MYLQDLGSSAYTEFDHDHDIVDLYADNEDLMNYRAGLIHSHHSMKAFFSGTDSEELHEKAENGLYLSLIVNNAMEPVAKLSWVGEAERKIETYSSWDLGIFKKNRRKYTKTEIVKVFHEIDMNIEFDEVLDKAAKRHDELEEEANIVATARNVHQGIHYGSKQGDIFGSHAYTGNSVGGGNTGASIRRQLGPDFLAKVKDANLLHKCFAGIILTDDTTRFLGVNTALSEAMTEVRDSVKEEMLPGQEYYTVYEELCSKYAEAAIFNGDDIVTSITNELYLTEEEYQTLILEMKDSLNRITGVLAEAFKVAIDEYIKLQNQ